MAKRSIEVKSGEVYGRLKILQELPRDSHSRRILLCLCACGTSIQVRLHRVISGGCRSCGCLLAASIRERSTTHGDSRVGKVTYLYNTWRGMVRRCLEKSHHSWYRYGGAGVTVEPAWAKSYQIFKYYVLTNLGHRPTSAHSIDRINNEGGYHPNNIRWATKSQQRRNTKINVYIVYKSHRRLLIDVCESLGLNYGTILQRYHKRVPAAELFLPIKTNSHYRH